MKICEKKKGCKKVYMLTKIGDLDCSFHAKGSDTDGAVSTKIRPGRVILTVLATIG